MTNKQRVIAIALAGTLLVGGFAFGRVSDPPKSAAAEENKAALTPAVSPTPDAATQAAKEDQAFFLNDFKLGYTEGYNAGLSGQASSTVNTTRAGYNDGFKQGFADGYKTRVNPQAPPIVAAAGPGQLAPRRVVYRSEPRRRSSTLKKVLTIAAPAAIGAGIGGAVGGGKGAGVGALLGGGGGALYTLIKDRN